MKSHFTFFILLFLPLLVFSQSETGSLKGTIYHSKMALPGAEIRVDELSTNISSDFNGAFRISNLVPGNHLITISYPGFNKKSIETEVSAGETKNLGVIFLEKEGVVELDKMVVIGSARSTQARAMMIDKQAPGIVDAIAADHIGKLPDRNAAEAVSRMSGVAIERDQGEGRYVSIRGMEPGWSAATINGSRLPSASGYSTGGRASMFDYLPAEMIEYIVVSKALTPDQEGDAIGGSANFITRSAPVKRTFLFNLGGGYHENGQGLIENGSLLWGDRIADGKFGYLVNLMLYNRNWGDNNFEPKRDLTSGGVHRIELRDYNGVRTTPGINVAFEYNMNANNKLYMKAMYGQLTDNEVNYKHRVRFEKNTVELQNIHNIMNNNLYGGQLGGVHNFGQTSKLEWSLAHWSSNFWFGDVPNSKYPSYFSIQFNQSDMGFTGLGLDGHDWASGEDNLVYTDLDGGKESWDNIGLHTNQKMDATKLKFSSFYASMGERKDRDNIVAQMDFSNNFSKRLKFKLGAKFRDKTRIATGKTLYFLWDEAAAGRPAPTLSELQTADQFSKDSYLDEFGNPYNGFFDKVLSVDGMNNFVNTYDGKGLHLDSTYSSFLENGKATTRNYDVYEKHIAGYVMADWTISDNLSMLAGLRAVETLSKVEGYLWIDNDGSDNDYLEEVTDENDYLSILPMVHLRYRPSNETKLHIALTRGFVRPGFQSIIPGGRYSPFDNYLSIGNPQLSPTYSWNFDLMADYFFTGIGHAFFGVFAKQISDPVFRSSIPGSNEIKQKYGIPLDQSIEVAQEINGKDAWVTGFELGLCKQLLFLPSFASGLGIEWNYTYLKSKMELPDGRITRLPMQADHLWNVGLFYDYQKFNAKLGLNFKDDHVREHGSNANEDEYYKSFLSVDLQAGYTLNSWLTVYGEIMNLTNAPMLYYLGHPERIIQAEYYGRRGMLGMRLSLF